MVITLSDASSVMLLIPAQFAWLPSVKSWTVFPAVHAPLAGWVVSVARSIGYENVAVITVAFELSVPSGGFVDSTCGDVITTSAAFHTWKTTALSCRHKG